MPALTGNAFAASTIVAAAHSRSCRSQLLLETTLTMSSWVSPSHLLTKDVLAVWGQQVEKATNGRVKLQMLPKHPSAAPGTLDAVRDGLVDVSYVTASYTPARHRDAAAGRVAGRWNHLRDQFGGLLAHPLEVSAAGRRI